MTSRRLASLLPFLSLLALGSTLLAATRNAALPASFAGWVGSGVTVPPVAAGTMTAVLREYGEVAESSRMYGRGQDSVNVILHQMKDPTGAYGLYSYLRTADMPRAEITGHSSASATRALILEGNLVLDVSGKNLPALESDWKALAAALAPQAIPGPYPTLNSHLPLTGLEERSDRYILGPAALHELVPIADGDWLGFSAGAEAEVAKYRVNGQEMTLLIADFPTPQMAGKKLDEFQKEFNLNGEKSGNGRPTIYATRSFTLLGVVSGARSQKEADLLLRQVSSATQLTWNEPGFSLTDPNMGAVIVGIIYGTGILCFFALVSGIAFGGVRIVVKRLLPGKVFDRGNQMDVLQLGLGSKPINSQDFYSLGKSGQG